MTRKPVPCRNCGEPIKPCGCVAHDQPMYWHWPARYHHCGDDGLGPGRAEPEEA